MVSGPDTHSDTPEPVETTVAVVGAGLAGLVLAATLREHGVETVVLEKSRGPGGRQSTRRESLGERVLHFDHGAQYFTIRDPDFRSFLDELPVGDAPLVREWTAPVVALEAGTVKARSENTRRFVFAPRMNSLARRLADGLHCRYGLRVASARPENAGWVLRDDEQRVLARSEILVLTAPAPQCLEMLPEDVPLRARLQAMRYAPCWSLMTHFPRSLEQSFGGAFVDASPLSWIANNDSKPGREQLDTEGESWVLQATPEWSYAHQEDDPASIRAALLEAFAAALGRDLPAPELALPHRWRFALPTAAAGAPCLWEPDARLGIAGDGCPQGARVEGAFASGRALAHRIRRAHGATA